jgi:hypothetical protein
VLLFLSPRHTDALAALVTRRVALLALLSRRSFLCAPCQLPLPLPLVLCLSYSASASASYSASASASASAEFSLTPRVLFYADVCTMTKADFKDARSNGPFLDADWKCRVCQLLPAQHTSGATSTPQQFTPYPLFSLSQITLQSLFITLQSLFSHSSITVQSLFKHSSTTLQSLFNHSSTTLSFV